MSRRVTLELPDEILNRAERLAGLAQREVADVLVEAVSAVLPPLDLVMEDSLPASALSDKAVLSLASRQLPAAQDRQLSHSMMNKSSDFTRCTGEKIAARG